MVAVASLAIGLGVARAVESTAAVSGEPVVVSRHLVPAIALPGGVSLGGLSDLCLMEDREGDRLVWTLTDRGPNGIIGTGDQERRTLMAPDFSPAVICLRVPAEGEAIVERVLPLSGAQAQPLTGRPNGVGQDRPILDAADHSPLSPDPNGVDPEGLVVLPDGSFWATEEYRPSLLRLSAEGRLLERHLPTGSLLKGADTKIVADIPAVYGFRRDNRGFEGLALSADASRLFVLLQSPLDHPTKKAAKQTGNVRMLVVDAASGSPLAEHDYRLGDPSAEGFATRGAPPDDGKLCCLAALADGSLLVLEQDDTGLARLYRADCSVASDTLPRTSRGEGEPLETIGDLAAAGIVPMEKTLVADLAALVPLFRRDVFGGDGSAGARLKLEGIAVLDDQQIMLVNDNDFSVPGATSDDTEVARSWLWVIGLANPLPSRPSQSRGP